jgi:hypothetical protein
MTKFHFARDSIEFFSFKQFLILGSRFIMDVKR